MGDAYYHAMAEWANRYAHNSAFTKKLWETNDPEALTQWLLHDPAGQAAKEKLILPAQDEEHVRQWVYNMAHNVNATIPDDLMRAHIVDREITAEQVAGYLHGRTDLQPVPYKEYTPDVIVGGEHLNRLVDKAYKYMWSMPENRLNRYPLYRTMYDNEVNRIVGDNMDQLVGRPDAEVRAWVSKYAQQPAALYAQAMVKKVVYNVERRALPAEKLRFISPFAQVTGNRLYFYGSQALENPQNIARLFVGWNAIGTTTDSSTGEKIFHIHLPGWLAKWVGQEDLPTLAVSKTSLNLISNSDPWWSPGFGPAVTIPAAEYMRHYAYQPNKSWLRTLTGSKGVGMFQNDYYGTDWMDLLSNSWERRIRASEGQQWANNSATIMAIENWKFDNGMRDKAPTMQEVADRTNALWAFRIVGAFVSPTQFTVHNDVVDEYTTKYREYSKKYGQQADQKFLADYPEYYNLVLNYSQNQTGIAATGGAADRADKHSTLLGDLQDPSMAAMVTNLPSDNGQFESTAYSYEYGHPLASGSSQVIRGPQDPQSVVENRYISKGWDMYRDAVKERNALLYAEGFHSDSQSGAEWIKAIYDQKIADITKATTVHKGDGTSYSPWAEQLGTTNPNLFANRAADLGRIVRDLSKDPANKGIYPWLPAAISYLQLRAQFQQTLAGQDAAGGSADLNARSNAWLKTIWEDQTKQLGDQNPQWADWASRYFTNDNLGSVPGG